MHELRIHINGVTSSCACMLGEIGREEIVKGRQTGKKTERKILFQTREITQLTANIARIGQKKIYIYIDDQKWPKQTTKKNVEK